MLGKQWGVFKENTRQIVGSKIAGGKFIEALLISGVW